MCPVQPKKRRYKRRGDAQHAARRLQTRGFGPHKVYKCPACGDYHLTTHPSSHKRE